MKNTPSIEHKQYQSKYLMQKESDDCFNTKNKSIKNVTMDNVDMFDLTLYISSPSLLEWLSVRDTNDRILPLSRW